MPRDNSTFREKVALRRRAMAQIDVPVVLETHGGAGKLYRACYAHVAQGVVFERDARKAEVLAMQRPTWAVYEGDCVAALRDDAAAWQETTLLDCDPYGEPWPVLRAFFGSTRAFAPRMAVVVNDGLRQKIMAGGAWSTASLQDAVAVFGNDIYHRYLDVCAWLLQQIAPQAGYAVRRFEGYYCGVRGNMTHYLAVLEQGELG